MRGKLVTQLPEIGKTLDDQLGQKGFQQASQIFGKLLVLNEDEHKFKDWLQRRCEIKGKNCRLVYSALQKWGANNFVSSPLKKKLVTELSGITEVWGEQLKQMGFQQASQNFGKFLVLNEDEREFKHWLHKKCAITERSCGLVY